MPKFFGKTRVRAPEVSGERLGRLFGFSEKPAVTTDPKSLFPEDPNALRRARRLFFPGSERPDDAALDTMAKASGRFQGRILPYRGRRADRAAYNYMRQTEPEHVANFLRDVDQRSVRSMARRRLKNLLWNNLSREEKRALNANPERKSAFMQDAVELLDGTRILPMTRFELARDRNTVNDAIGRYRWGTESIRPTVTIDSSERARNITAPHELAGHGVDYTLQDTYTGYNSKQRSAEERLKRMYDTDGDRSGGIQALYTAEPGTEAFNEAFRENYKRNLHEHIARVTEYAFENSTDRLDLFDRSVRYWPDDVKADFAEWMRRRSGIPESVPAQEIIDFYSSYPEMFGGGGHLEIYRKYFTK